MFSSSSALRGGECESLSSIDTDLHNSGSNMRQPLFTRQPLAYRVGSSTLRVQTKFVTAVSLIGCGALLLIYVMVPSSRTTDHHYSPPSLQRYQWMRSSTDADMVPPGAQDSITCRSKSYNSTYPMSDPIIVSGRGVTRYRIAVVADLDTDSKDKEHDNAWISYLKKGYLEINRDYSRVQVYWDASVDKLTSRLSYGGRGLELSELVVFNGKLYTVDDRTGVVYHLDANTNALVPWVMLTDGDGNNEKGFKSEWATVRDGLLYIGGLGKEWTTTSGEMLNHNPQWVKTVDTDGHVENYNWTDRYIKLRDSVNIRFPGYMIHEAVCWSSARQEWVFMPRRASTDRYDEVADERMGTDLMLAASASFSSVVASHVGKLIPTHGFSSFKFIPDTKDEVMVALKSEEVEGRTSTYIMALNRAGQIIMPETKLGDHKYEGIEFI